MIIALAGRRIDPEDAGVARFPLANVELVERRLRGLFESREVHALVASAACGADLIAQRVAHSLVLQRVMVLPYPPHIFRERSVADRPGNWGPEFDALLADARTGTGEVVELNAAPAEDASQAAYEQANTAILDRAAALATARNEEVLPLIVWEGKSRGHDDLTAAFADAARARGLTPVSVSTLL